MLNTLLHVTINAGHCGGESECENAERVLHYILFTHTLPSARTKVAWDKILMLKENRHDIYTAQGFKFDVSNSSYRPTQQDVLTK